MQVLQLRRNITSRYEITRFGVTKVMVGIWTAKETTVKIWQKIAFSELYYATYYVELCVATLLSRLNKLYHG